MIICYNIWQIVFFVQFSTQIFIMIYRKKYIDSFHKLIQGKLTQYYAIVWPYGIGKSTFLRECEQFDVFGDASEYQHINLEKGESLSNLNLTYGVKYVIIDSEEKLDIGDIRSFIESLLSDKVIIFTSEEELYAEDVTIFQLPTIWLREFLEHETWSVNISDIFSWNLDISKLNKFRDIYIKNGWYPEHLLLWVSIKEDFLRKRAIIVQELFEKEYSTFDIYMRTIAMNIGNLFKADQIAKLLNISRRKVNKYTELLIKYDIVKAIGPWVQDANTETSRHVKLYFSDLGYLSALLWEIHGEGTLRQWATENLIFLELQRKLGDSHTLYFYRKKSGAEIAFIAENNENTLITPIEVTTRSTDVSPQVFRVFDEEYHERIERYMIFNDTKWAVSSLNDTQIMILPHIGI